MNGTFEGLAETPQGIVAVFKHDGVQYTCPVERVYTEDERFAESCKKLLRLKFPNANRFIWSVHDWSVYEKDNGEIDMFNLYADARGFLGRGS